MDGQQRLTAIFEFCSNDRPLSKQSTEEFGGDFYKNLPIGTQEAFDDFKIEYDEIEEATEEELKEFFQRLQEGLPTTSSEKLNAVHSKFRDQCKKLASHAFFRTKVAVPNTRYAHFDIVSKVATIEVEGISTGLRYSDIKKVFDANVAFSPTSAAAKKLKNTFDYLNRVFSEQSMLLRNRTVVQAFSTLVARVIDTGKADGHDVKVKEFFERFMKELSAQVELGQNATDNDYISFQRSINANVRGGAKLRQEVLLRKLLIAAPDLADLFDPSIVAESGLRGRIGELGESVTNLIAMANSAYSSKHGKDLFETYKQDGAGIKSDWEVAKDLAGYGTFIDDLYFIVHEGSGTRLAGIAPTSFVDINLLRTELRHDVDHGDKSKIRAKRKKIGTAFSKYAGSPSPQTVGPERFAAIQANILTALESDFHDLIASIS